MIIVVIIVIVLLLSFLALLYVKRKEASPCLLPIYSDTGAIKSIFVIITMIIVIAILMFFAYLIFQYACSF